jgi:hypothetical protein
LEAFAKRSLDDPDFFKAVKDGDLSRLDELKITSKVITDLIGHRREDILNRHRYGAGKPDKTEFPVNWSDDKIIDNVNKIANSVNIPGGIGPYNAPYKIGTIDGIKVRVDFYPPNHPKYAGKVSTAYPINVTPSP